MRVLGASGSEGAEILRFAHDDSGAEDDSGAGTTAAQRMTAVLLRMTVTERMPVGFAQDDNDAGDDNGEEDDYDGEDGGMAMIVGSEEGLGISISAVWDEGGWVAEIRASSCTRKRLGEQAEAAFLNKATGLGLSVATPWGDSERYDFLVRSGRRLWRVQVKSTRYVGERRFSITARGCTAAYTQDEIDFLAVYIVPLGIWYIVPVRAFAPSKCLRFYPSAENSRGQYEKYREAWWRLGAESGR